MTASLNKYDIVVVRFPFTDSAKHKARPAVVISNEYYNRHSRNAIIILAITSQFENKLPLEKEITHWQKSGLLKPSLFKASVATIDKQQVITKLGKLERTDILRLLEMLKIMID